VNSFAVENVIKAEQALIRDQSYPSPRDMVHTSIFSNQNFEQMLTFYQVVLNMRVVYEINSKIRFVALSFDEENHRIGLVKLPSLEQRPQGTVRIEHLSWRYRNLPALFNAIRHIEAELGLFPAAVHQGTIISVSYRDPDENRCELIVECLPSQEDIIDFYVNKLAAQPDFNTLLPFNLRGMMEMHAAGEGLANLLNYGWVKENLPVEGLVTLS